MPGAAVLTVTFNPCIDKTVAVEDLRLYELNRVKSSRMDFCGKGINVAKVLRTAYDDVAATGFIADKQSSIYKEDLKKAGISADFIEIHGETRTNLKVLDETANKITEINESGFFVSEENISSFFSLFEKLIKDTGLVVLSGSLPPGAPYTIYRDCIKIAHKSGAKAIVDCDGEALAEGITAFPDAIKPNTRELEILIRRSLKNQNAIVNAASELIKKGVRLVAVSMGADGAIITDGDSAYKTSPFNIEIKSPTGAGDSMVAALACGMMSGRSLEEIAKASTAAGTLTASLPGTQLCSLKEAFQFKDKVRAIKI